jgi:hypothetical protein
MGELYDSKQLSQMNTDSHGSSWSYQYSGSNLRMKFGFIKSLPQSVPIRVHPWFIFLN